MTSSRTPADAAVALRDALQRIISCVSAGVLIYERGTPTGELRVRAPVLGSPLSLRIEYRFAVVSSGGQASGWDWHTRAVSYMYAISGADAREILAYHWHPAGRGGVRDPHLHLGAGTGPLPYRLREAHLPTGPVTPVAVVALLIEHFGVRPRRADWRRVLERAASSILD